MKTVRSVERALAILFAVARSDEPATLSELARAVSLDKATTLRLLMTLEAAGVVKQDPVSKRYAPGPTIGSLAASWRNDLREAARPYLKTLWRQTGETIGLVSPRGMERVYVDMLVGTHELSIVPVIGSAVPIHAGASGKVLLAFSSLEWVEQVIEVTGLKPVNAAGVSDPMKLRKILEDVRRQGYAISIGDVVTGSAALAAPVFDRDGEIAASVVIRGPEIRLTRQKLQDLSPLAVETGEQISRALGWRGAIKPRPTAPAKGPRIRVAG